MTKMLDLKVQIGDIRDELIEMVTGILESAQYILGPKVSEFEKKVSEYVGAADSVGVASGTDALFLALKGLGIGKGDEVVTSPFTFFATAEAILYTGATPVFADIEPDTFNIDPERIKEKVNRRTKAVLPVHIFGHPADMEAITDIARRHNLYVVEDCAQAFGASCGGRIVGSFGDAGCFSFYPSKNLGACGDGGLITVKDPALSENIRKLRNHGSSAQYMHDTVGSNSRLDELQAGILLVKLKRIDDYNEKRRKKAALYTKLISGDVAPPVQREGFRHVYHQYTVRTPKRDAIRKRLAEEDIPSMVYYPLPLHLQKALGFLGCKEGDFPEAERAAKEVLSLPMYPELPDSDIEKTAEALKNATRPQ